jgi:hypothetical protein
MHICALDEVPSIRDDSQRFPQLLGDMAFVASVFERAVQSPLVSGS